MEVPGGHANKIPVLVYEFMGTAALLMAVNMGHLLLGGNMTPEAVGLTIYTGIMYLGSVSGGHFNPAVSTGVFLREANFGKHWMYYLMIIFSQLCGGTVGVLIVTLCLKRETNVYSPPVNTLCPSRAGWDPSMTLCNGDGYFF